MVYMASPIQKLRQQSDLETIHRPRYEMYLLYIKNGKTMKDCAKYLKIHFQTLRDSINRVIEHEKKGGV